MTKAKFPTKRIRDAHAEGQKVLKKAKLISEVPEVALAVERHRWAWKPTKITTVLIAESHVYTTKSELGIRVRNDLLSIELRNLPTEFVRLVYCLGYGNNSVLTKKTKKRNAGTWQFWKLFGAITKRNPYPTKGKDCERLKWQIATLEELSRKGIWLLDSSLHGIYEPGGGRVRKVTEELHQIWWDHYGKWLLGKIKHKQVWAIGKGVKSTLEGLDVKLNGWIYQPNARNIPSKVRQAQLKELVKTCCKDK